MKIPLERRQEIGVTTATVERRVIGGSIDTNGVIAEDEGRVHSVNARFTGYIERLLVDRTGQPVRAGPAASDRLQPGSRRDRARASARRRERAAAVGLLERRGRRECPFAA